MLWYYLKGTLQNRRWQLILIFSFMCMKKLSILWLAETILKRYCFLELKNGSEQIACLFSTFKMLRFSLRAGSDSLLLISLCSNSYLLSNYPIFHLSKGSSGCKRGKPLWAHREKLRHAAGTPQGARIVPLHSASLSLHSVRWNRARHKPGDRIFCQVKLWSNFSHFQQN